MFALLVLVGSYLQIMIMPVWLVEPKLMSAKMKTTLSGSADDADDDATRETGLALETTAMMMMMRTATATAMAT